VRSSVLSLLVVAGGLFGNEVQASVRFCNRTDSPTSLSVAWRTVPLDDSHVARARGWWSLAPNECRTVAGDLDASKIILYYHAHSRDRTTWGKTLPYQTLPDGRTQILTDLRSHSGEKVYGLCVRADMFDREMRVTGYWEAMEECQRGFYPAGFWSVPPSPGKDIIHNLTRKKLKSE
jgi:uncharacterized protein DUF1036